MLLLRRDQILETDMARCTLRRDSAVRYVISGTCPVSTRGSVQSNEILPVELV